MKTVVAALIFTWAGSVAAVSASELERAPTCGTADGKPRAVSEHEYVAIGGLDQWLVIEATS